jgi:hypothetical protein
MCVSHAELVCRQIQEMYPHLRTDWVGTGVHGRPDDINREIIRKFCPKKTDDGKRPAAEIDVLVHVGKAGEGLDCIFVSEYVFLKAASVCNKNVQEVGRASRYLPGVIANISFDSTSEFSSYVGVAMHEAMDAEPPPPDDDDDPDKCNGDGEPPPLPEEPHIQIFNMELIDVDSGSPSVQRFARVMEEGHYTGIDYGALDDKSHPEWQKIIRRYKDMRDIEAAPFKRESEIKQWQEAVEGALSSIAGRVVRRIMSSGARPEKSLAGDIKRRINTAKKARFGPVGPDIEICRNHWKWLKELETEILENGVPQWLL